ncbi:MAG: methylmalonyl Co-A mutase-associated GTPase MeaB [Candidatus Kapaibacterium sp.]
MADSIKRNKLEIEDYVRGVLDHNRMILGRAITLAESNSRRHQDMAQELLKRLLPHTGNSVRIGITGPPGAGKSTLIESLGVFLCGLGYKVAVLAIDPSSSVSRGSILGDKTRMERLTQLDNSFIRPSPSGGTLGGVARKTRESMLICEAAGYDILLIETIGVGQSEVTVRSMVDYFMLVLLPGSGDELQGIKKGVVELADALVVNKADGDAKNRARITQMDYQKALNLLQSPTEGWTPQVFTASAVRERGIADIWQNIVEFRDYTQERSIFESRRKNQMLEWMESLIGESLRQMFYENEYINEALPEFREKVASGELPPTLAVERLMRKFLGE